MFRSCFDGGTSSEYRLASSGDREQLHGHRGAIIWFTGLSGSGKSTLTGAVEQQLYQLGVSLFLLDGDSIRHGLCKDLGFSDTDRKENIRRVGEVASLMSQAGIGSTDRFYFTAAQ